MKYSVVIPTYNHCDDLLKPCVESIFKYTNLADIELIISANGCTDNTSQYLDELRYKFNSLNLANNFQVAWSDKALGYPKATNDGIKLATTDKIVLLNNDCILLQQKENDWLNILNYSFNVNEKCGISCVAKEFSPHMRAHFAIFFCVMVHKKLFNEIGYLNEEFGTGSGEDMEFCILAQKKGYEICQTLETSLGTEHHIGGFPIYHLGEGTVHDKNLVQKWSATFFRNGMKLAKKYNDDWNKTINVNEKKVGVITPIYNSTEYLYRTLDSVKKQTHTNIVHYIYDDASNDGIELCKEEFENNPSFVFIQGKENKGQSFGRNVLLKKAIEDNCEIIAFLDSDDFWHSDHIEKSLKYLEENDIVYSKPHFSDDFGNPLNPASIIVPNMFIGKQLYHNNYIWISSVVAKKECFEHNEFDSSLNSIEDWDMWIRLHEQNYKFVDKNLATNLYVVRNNSQASLGHQKMFLFEQKHKRLHQLKLHLACGHDYTEGYINVDLYAPEDAKCDVRFDVMKLPYPDNSIDEIKAFHIIEHFHFFEVKDVLNEWYRVLKPGGRLWIETPDFLESCRSFVEGSPTMNIEDWRILLYNHFFAHPWVPGQTHKFLFTESQLTTNLSWAGFKIIKRSAPASGYVMPHTAHLFLNMEAFK